MEVGQLFLSLGIKGADKTVAAIGQTRKGLEGVASTSLEAKAAIIGAMYALERLFATSGKAGTDLTNFSALMGGGMVQTLQRYQYAARQAGVANAEVEGTFKSLQGAMTKTLMGEGAPKGLAQVARLTGGLTAEDIKKFAEQPQLLIQRLQEYAQKETNAGLRNEVLKSFGVSDGMIAAMTRGAFRPEALARAPTYSDKEVGQLDKANIAWSNLGNKIEMAVGHFNAAHGGELVKDISLITDKVIGLANAFERMAQKTHLFNWIGKSFEGWAMILDHVPEAIDKILEGWSKLFGVLGPVLELMGQAAVGDKDKQGELKDSAKSFITQDLPQMFSTLTSEIFGDKPEPGPVPKHAVEAGDRHLRLVVPAPAVPAPTGASAAAPRMPASPATSPQPAKVEINQSLNFQHDGTDAQRVADAHKKGIRDALRQSSALAGGQ